MKKNKKWFIAIGMSLGILFLVTVIFFFVKYQEKEVLLTSENINNIIEWNINNVRNDIKEKSGREKEITNFKLNSFWREVYDDGTINEFNVIDTIRNNSNIDKVQFVDRIMTSRRRELSFLGERKTPDKINNTFRIDLTDFLDDNNNKVNSLNAITFEYGTSPQNTPAVYIVINRIKKDIDINLDNTFEENLSKKGFWKNLALYWKGNSSTDLFSLDYKKITGSNWNPCSIEDKELKVKWCKKINFNDFLSNEDFDLNKYFYKVFLVFWNTRSNKDKVPFKLTSPNWNFGLGNFSYNDLTLLTPDNTKKRFIIESSSNAKDGWVLPYLLYSLWVDGEVRTDGE